MTVPDGSPEADPDFDVIVVGAGIAGAVTAYQLAEVKHGIATNSETTKRDIIDALLAL